MLSWRSTTPLRLLAALAAATALVTGCGSDGDAAGDAGRPTVVATTAFLADVVEAVAGPDAEVVQLVPDSADPHSFSASAKDRATLEDADLVVAVGGAYEEGLPLDEVSAPRLDLADRAGGDDPHVWMDPTVMAAAAPRIAQALAQADPAQAEAHRRRGRAEARRLEALDRELQEILADVPGADRKLVTSHDSMRRFAERYDFEVVAAPFGLAPEGEASGRDVARVIDRVRVEEVPVVFAADSDDPEVLRRVADATDVEVVDDLLVENPGAGADTYAEAMRHTARRIAEGLGPA